MVACSVHNPQESAARSATLVYNAAGVALATRHAAQRFRPHVKARLGTVANVCSVAMSGAGSGAGAGSSPANGTKAGGSDVDCGDDFVRIEREVSDATLRPLPSALRYDALWSVFGLRDGWC